MLNLNEIQKKLWQLINKISGKHNNKTELVECLSINNIDHYDAKSITNEFGKHFSTVGKKFAELTPKLTKPSRKFIDKIILNEKSMFLHDVSENEIRNIIDSLENKSSSGFDDISNIILKKLKFAVVPPLTKIVNLSLATGIFPEKMKHADVVPLYKNKNRKDVTNYRPISLLLTLSKILEKGMYTRTYKFLNDTDQIFGSQYGFRTKHSCDNAIGELLGNIIKNQELGKYTIALFLDLLKAFDTLKHEILLNKLEIYVIRGLCLNWFKSYLSNRKMRVKCKVDITGNVKYLDTYDINYGTPQGSCLGPLLFLIFCNDINLHLDFMNVIQFADDTTLYLSGKNLNYLQWCVECDVRSIIDWFRANKLTLNPSKTICVVFNPPGRKKVTVELEFGDVKLKSTNTTKFLGVWIDSCLNWNEHLKQLMIKLKRNLGLLRNSKNFLLKHGMRLLYYAQFHSHLSYSISIWGCMIKKEQLNKIDKLQKKAISLINLKSNVSAIMNDERLLSIEEIIKLELLKIGHRLSTGTLPTNLSRDLKKDHLSNSLVKEHNYDMRHKRDLYLPKVKGKIYRDSFLYKCILEYNNLRKSLKSVKTYQCLLDCAKKNYLTNKITGSIKVSVITLKKRLHYMHIPSYNINKSHL